jgi:hypothetical protein
MYDQETSPIQMNNFTSIALMAISALALFVTERFEKKKPVLPMYATDKLVSNPNIRRVPSKVVIDV